jgi:hypothetical protein
MTDKEIKECVHLRGGTFAEAMARISITPTKPEYATAATLVYDLCPFCTGALYWGIPQIIGFIGPEPLHKP